MELTSRIKELLSPSLEALGYEVVRVKVFGEQMQTLQIMMERIDRKTLTIDDCTNATPTISALLDVEDPIFGNYTLEVSSPGIDRPLTRFDDFSRYSGFEAKIEMRTPIEGRRRFRGSLIGTEGESVIIAVDGAKALLPFAFILSAKLILTDELIEAEKKERRV